MLNLKRIQQIQASHPLAKVISLASQETLKIPFYERIGDFKSAQDFVFMRQMHYHSRTLPKFIALRMSLDGDTKTMMPFYAGHIWEEAFHSNYLEEWLIQHSLITSYEELIHIYPTPQTIACVAFGNLMATSGDREAWLVAMNCGIEKCSHILFSKITPVVESLGIGHKYFSIHVEADEYHSIEGLYHVEPHSLENQRGRYLRQVAFNAISLWCGMLNSWVGVNEIPQFEESGQLLNFV